MPRKPYNGTNYNLADTFEQLLAIITFSTTFTIWKIIFQRPADSAWMPERSSTTWLWTVQHSGGNATTSTHRTNTTPPRQHGLLNKFSTLPSSPRSTKPSHAHYTSQKQPRQQEMRYSLKTPSTTRITKTTTPTPNDRPWTYLRKPTPPRTTVHRTSRSCQPRMEYSD